MTTIQKRAVWSLLIGSILSVGIIVLFISKGVSTFHEELGMRIIVYALQIGALATPLVVTFMTRRKSTQAEIICDERDKVIEKKAVSVQLVAVIGSLVVWTIALTEAYWDEGEIPIAFPYLIFFSSLIVATIARSVGILLGYWRMEADVES